jgi:hypothetical protein
MKMKKTNGGPESFEQVSPQQQLLSLIDDALGVAKTARRHRKALDGANFYAAKMANLRADATNSFSRLASKSVGDTSAQAELMQRVFSVAATAKERAQAAQELQFKIKTDWAALPSENGRLEESGVFPLVTLSETGRGYLVSIGRQANGCYTQGWYDGCAVMMRRLLESSVIEAFEAKKIDAKIKDSKSGDFFQLTALITAALAETTWNLPRNVRKEIENLRDLGHRSAHNRYYLAKKPDIDKHAGVYREAVEAFLHLAGLL